MEIRGAVALVTGANRGLGQVFARELVSRGAAQAFDAVAAGRLEVLADKRSRQVKADLQRDHELIYPAIQAFWESTPAPGEA
jgi:NAD(P)-dependent dehydrogenase (short-subunit alcohol dehydrogenase family)